MVLDTGFLHGRFPNRRRVVAIEQGGEMATDLNLFEINLVLESLRYTKRKFSEYQRYPSAEFQCERCEEVQHVIEKLKHMKGELACSSK